VTLKRNTPLRAKPRSKGNRVCACGCGTEIPERTTRGAPQFYAHGHNGRISPYKLIEPEDRGYYTPCWIWKGGTSGNGYGRLSWRGHLYCAHRWFYEDAGNTIPTGLQLDHLCKVGLCVNPTHLEPVSAAENVQRSSKAKLTAAQVARIVDVRDEALAAAGPTRDGQRRRRVPNGRAIRAGLAAEYGVTPDQIKHIWGSRSWVS
jgi:hypothetical protein